MFKNPGNKIQLVAELLFGLGAVFGSVAVFIFGILYEIHFFLCLLYIISGLPCLYIVSLLIYGFGQLILNTQSIDEKIVDNSVEDAQVTEV